MSKTAPVRQFTSLQIVQAQMLQQGNLGRCKTCGQWDQRYPQNEGLGLCARINASAFLDLPDDVPSIALGPHQLAINLAQLHGPFRHPEALEVRTREDFGCIQWMPKP